MSSEGLQSSDTVDGFCVQMQVGVLREWINVDIDPSNTSDAYSVRSSKFNALKESAAAMVSRTYPEQKFVGLQNQLHLFLHNASDQNMLKIITSQTDVPEGSLIQVVLSGKISIEDLCAREHILSIHSYKSPHFCDFCGEMLWGLVKQGLKCEACGRNFHKRCVYKIREHCMASRPPSVKVTLDDQLSKQYLLNGTNSIFSSRGGSVQRLQVPHTFVAHNYTLPTICQCCYKLLPIVGQSLQCKDCKLSCHKKCMELLPNNCQGESRGIIYEEALDSSFGDDPEPDASDKMLTASSETTPTNLNKSPLPSTGSTPLAAGTQPATPSSGTSSSTSSSGNESSLGPKQSNNIPLQRVVQSFRNVKQCASQTIRNDWMVWWTNHNPARRHHYWTLDAKSITFYSEEVKKRYFKVIQLKDITRLELANQNEAKKTSGPYHVFEMVVGETTYCVGEDFGDERSEVDRERAVCFENAIRQALLPLTPQNSIPTKDPGGTTSSSNEGKITDINQRYEINPEEVLGSGQFGIVYGAIHIYKKHEVAIKVIDKAKFKDKQEAQLKNEVSILQNISHPGVVNLEYVFESKDKIYVVMEKLKGDMLDMILHSPGGKLTERITKFLVYQILIALKYLHDNNIVHCDLKPENVLLSSNSRFPQVKLCDFGFAKIIGEKSFRRSIVGTPAYLAPEVLKNKRYNRSLDMWSVGVVLYVSLSGTFPFNEDEDINDQIHNAAFMFPKSPWGSISKQAMDLITKILQVQLKNRFKVSDALNHVWMQDYQCYADLKVLEEQVGIGYLATKEDDAKWAEHAKVKKLPHWRDVGHVDPNACSFNKAQPNIQNATL